MKIFTSTFTHNYEWEEVSLAHWMKYPNPFASHVLTSDTLSISLMPASTGYDARITKLYLKKSSLPRWATALLPKQFRAEAYILEETFVSPSARRMMVRSRNISHVGLLSIQESQEVIPCHNTTIVRSDARFVSGVWLKALRDRIESSGLKRFNDGFIRSRMGLEWVLERVRRLGFRHISGLK